MAIKETEDSPYDLARRRDIGLLPCEIAGLRRAVKWNSPFYGTGEADAGWFLSFHCFARCVKVTFFRGSELDPVPPVGSKHPGVRYAHLHEGEALDGALWTGWVAQASRLPGERL